MSNLNLTQTDLNEPLRGLTDVDIMMFLPDKNVSFPSNAVTLNKQALSYTSNLQSLLEFSSLPQANIATFENNSWIEIKGTIKLKDYHGPMPIIEVFEIKKITTPNETAVYPPKNKF